MKTKKLLYTSIFILGLSAIYLFNSETEEVDLSTLNNIEKRTSGAGEALEMWSYERAYPFEHIPVSKYLEAFETKKEIASNRTIMIEDDWESLGPKNIGGRTLCLAFHPIDENIMYAGSASGGLWKTTTQGVGEDAWEKVPTGFPVLGVATIAIDQNDPDTMYIGTGETYGVGFAEPGTVNRLTRGTYGIGILKTVDGGVNWTQVLIFEMNELKGVQDIVISEQNSSEIYAATTDGLYQSLDGGNTWELILDIENCIDVELDPNDGNIIYVTHGNFNFDLDPDLSGIFKSTDKGVSFNELLDPGLITAWSGNAKLSIDPSNSNTLYASIQVGWFNNGPTTPNGIYKSTNAGVNWTKINDQNIARWQGWYSHDIAINPNNSSEIINVGINTWKSINTGENFTQKTVNSWTMGEVPVDIPEGGADYVHSDIHAVYYHPINNKLFLATDGGVFVSDDGELPYTTLNGGLQTTQFYANMGSSATNPNLLIAGAQDNASWVYKGNPSWWRVIGGDGMSASVNQWSDQVVYGSWQGLNIVRSTNGGNTFNVVRPTLVTNDFTAFSAPYEIAPSNQNILYAGGTYLYKSVDGADNWDAISSGQVDVNPIMKIAISFQDPEIVYVSTSPDPTNGPGGAKILKSVDGGVNFTQLTNGLPDRICKDIEIDPQDDSIVYAVFSGFGTDHVYKSVDGGSNWLSISDGLPDVPTNTILIDPLSSDDIYVGNDLGVYYSDDGGSSWNDFNDALPEAVMIYDLDYSHYARKIRIATHGNGIFQRDFVTEILNINDNDPITEMNIYPNPARDELHIQFDYNSMDNTASAQLEIYNVLGQLMMSIDSEELVSGINSMTIDVSKYRAGTYFLKLNTGLNSSTKTLIIQ
jgi:photosystem II stability/assembly factor-like uncharacterized protein